VKNSETFECLL